MPMQIEETDDFVVAFCDAIELSRNSIVAASGHARGGALQFASERRLLAELASTCLWATVAQEEGRFVRGSICLNTSDNPGGQKQRFATPLELSVENIKRLLTASPRRATGAEVRENRVCLWGYWAAPQLSACVIQLLAPGVLSASIGSRLIAVIERERCILPKDAHSLTWPYIISNAVQRLDRSSGLRFGLRIQRLAAAMSEHRHGGTIVVMPASDQSWERSVTIPYRFDNASSAATLELIQSVERAQREFGDIQQSMFHGWKDESVPWNAVMKSQASEMAGRFLQSHLDALGELTAIDGALVMDDDLRVHGFGAKLHAPPREGVEIVIMDALTGGIERKPLENLGGTRHQSAARLVLAHNNAAAFVASQDGRLTLLVWIQREGQIVALRGLEYLVALQQS